MAITKAIIKAINYDALASVGTGGAAPAALGYLSPASPYYNETYTVEEISDISQYSVNDNFLGGIDIRIASGCVYIEGWAIEHRAEDNMDMYVDLLLQKVSPKEDGSGELIPSGKCYKVSTTKVHRKDVAETFKDEIGVEFAGFRTRIPREGIEDGEYEICILYKDMILRTEVTIDK